MVKFHTYGFEKLDVYRNALKFSSKIRSIIINFPKHERYNLSNQLMRSSDSIAANIAEGSGRWSNQDQANFTNTAYASGLETVNHLNLALQLDYIDIDTLAELRLNLDLIMNQLNALYKYQLNRKDNLKTKTINK